MKPQEENKTTWSCVSEVKYGFYGLYVLTHDMVDCENIIKLSHTYDSAHVYFWETCYISQLIKANIFTCVGHNVI